MKPERPGLVVVCALTLCVSLVGCGSDDSRDIAALEGSWVLVEFDADDVDADPSVTTTLILDGGKVSGSGGVNNLIGTYSTPEPGEVTFSPVGTTQMAGPENAMAQEARFLANLELVAKFEVDSEDGELDLNDERDDTLLVLRPAP